MLLKQAVLWAEEGFESGDVLSREFISDYAALQHRRVCDWSRLPWVGRLLAA
jgi:hypothetical protein